jgi:tRNA uridine 5-carboxymethylaminomethyl modification enzyme
MSHNIGLASDERLRLMEQKKQKSEAFIGFFKESSVAPELINPILEAKNSATVKQSDKLFKPLSRPNITMYDMQKIDFVSSYIDKHDLDHEVLQQTEIQIKYAGYIAKEKNNADKLNRLEGIKIPESFDYSKLKSLSYEAKEKLSAIKPVTVSQASRISGVSPNDISVMLVYMGR